MKFFFCDVCGTRVSDADLRAGMGLRRRHDVICATCLELGHGKAWSQAGDSGTRVAPAVAAPLPPVGAPEPTPAVTSDTPAPDSLAAAACGLGALDAVAGPASAPAPAEDLPDAAPAGQPPTTSRTVKPPSTRSSRSPSKAGKSSRSAASSTRAQRKAANDRRKLILIILVLLCLVSGGALAVLMFAPGLLSKVGIGPKAPAGTEIRLKDVRDELFKQITETRRMAFREPATLSTAEVEATIARIHAMSDAIDAFGETAAKGGWSEEHVSSQLASWNVRDIMGKLRMWNDERAKRAASGK